MDLLLGSVKMMDHPEAVRPEDDMRHQDGRCVLASTSGSHWCSFHRRALGRCHARPFSRRKRPTSGASVSDATASTGIILLGSKG
jgi:hypothetical protein